MNVLFICHGNLCRSPVAEALLRKKFKDSNIDGEISSAGFESFNINEPPDPRAVDFAEEHGIKLDHRARIFLKSDFDKFDKIFVMDTRNYRDVKDLAKNNEDINKIDYLMNVIGPKRNRTIPDPFLSGKMEMNTIFELIDQATDKIVEMAKNN